MQSGLVSAYRATDYVAHGNGWVVVIRIGRHSLVVDRLLARMHARNGAFITAWNPFSKDLSFEANEHWDRELKRDLSARGFAFVEGEGRGRTGEWPPEPASLRLGFHARKPLRLVESIGKMLSSTCRGVGQPNWLCCDG
jgi:uncharacterized protein DUF3293